MTFRFPSADADILLKAFEVLDKDSKGFLTAQELRQVFYPLRSVCPSKVTVPSPTIFASATLDKTQTKLILFLLHTKS
jgi:Ca2+-binding EF-hand superfamily protein